MLFEKQGKYMDTYTNKKNILIATFTILVILIILASLGEATPVCNNLKLLLLNEQSQLLKTLFPNP